VLLDEINLATAETLDCLCGILDTAEGSVTLVDRGYVSSSQPSSCRIVYNYCSLHVMIYICAAILLYIDVYTLH